MANTDNNTGIRCVLRAYNAAKCPGPRWGAYNTPQMLYLFSRGRFVAWRRRMEVEGKGSSAVAEGDGKGREHKLEQDRRRRLAEAGLGLPYTAKTENYWKKLQSK